MSDSGGTVEVTTVSFSFVGDRSAVVAEEMNRLAAEVSRENECTLLGGQTSVNTISATYIQSGRGDV